jgi:hypothetical protein
VIRERLLCAIDPRELCSGESLTPSVEKGLGFHCRYATILKSDLFEADGSSCKPAFVEHLIDERPDHLGSRLSERATQEEASSVSEH